MMAVTVCYSAVPSGHDHIGTKFSDGVHHICQKCFLRPDPLRFDKGFGKAEVIGSGKVLRRAIEATRLKQLFSTYNPQGI